MAAAVVEARERTVRIGTRGSALALIQTEIVVRLITRATPGIGVELVRIVTRGDAVTDRPLSEIGGKGLFVGEIEHALRAGEIDLAVHSSKDMPSELAPDMAIGAFLKRADARDALVSGYFGVDGLPTGARVGTSSPRRQSQLRALRPDLELIDIRGNVDTRIRKLDAGGYDAIVLAMAGLDRLGLSDDRIQPLPLDVMLPAVGQGAIAVEIRADDRATMALVAPLSDRDTTDEVMTERAFLAATGGTCDTAIAAHATLHAETLTLTGLVDGADGSSVRAVRRAVRADAVAMAREMAQALMRTAGRMLVRPAL